MKTYHIEIDKGGRFSSLKAGWFNGSGESYSQEDIQWVQKHLEVLELPYEYFAHAALPTVDGHFYIKWADVDGQYLTLTIDPKTKRGSCNVFCDYTGDSYGVENADLSTEEGWAAFLKPIIRIMKRAVAIEERNERRYSTVFDIQHQD